MQECIHCKVEKPYEDYHRSPNSASGFLSVCKPCRKIQQIEYRKTVKGKETDKKYNNSEKRYKALYRYWHNNPDKKTAQTCLSNAIRDGKIIKPSECECCDSTSRLEGHHYSYDEDKRLDVIWLCKSCHEKEHMFIKRNGYKSERGLYLSDDDQL